MGSMKNASKSESVKADTDADGAGALAQDPENSGAVPDPMSILNQAGDAIIILDLDGAVRYWNRAAERLFEWPLSEAMQRHAQDFLWTDSSSVDDALAGVLARGIWNGELAIATKSGGRLIVESRWSLLRDERTRSPSVLTIHSDITEKAKRNEQFARVRQLESLGDLARGFAHDLNNVLGPIIMAADLFKLTMKSERELDLLEMVEVSARRGSEIVKQMLSFSKAYNPGCDAGEEAQASGADDGLPRGHGELILLVDDETSIRLITGRALEAHGYQVITACNGAEGLAKYSARRGDVALVITDMMMPVLSGAELIRSLMESDPLVKVIASSGVNMKGAEEEAARNGGKWFLRKPYTVARLLAAIEDALHPRKSA
jgi:PAS domain S-box-containing protein